MGWDGMARAGRKRKNVPRLAGRIDWRAEREDPTLTATWSRAREAFLEFGKNPFLASQAGRAYVFRQLTAVEAEAAKRWAEMLVTNRRVIIGQTGAGLSRERDPAWIAEFRERFNELQAIILQAGKPALMALNKLCRDEAGEASLPQAKLGLAQLVVHFRLDTPRHS
jgi:hypothetical protein